MSLKQLFDTPDEMAYWFGALADMSDAISASVIVVGNPYYALITILTSTIGRKVSGYYKLQMEPKKKDEPPTP